MSSSTEVLVVGGGPSGLVLALSLVHRGVPMRIVDQRSGPGQASRAMAVQARTLEFYQQMGFAQEMVDQGVKVEAAHLREGGKDAARFDLAEIGRGLSPFPFVLAYPQDDHERFLVGKLADLGVRVEYGVALEEFSQDGQEVRAVLNRSGSREECSAAYLCGCDGAHSLVRHRLELGFPGGAYDQLFYVADVEIAEGFAPDLFMNVAAKGFALMLPVRSRGMQRLIGIVPAGLDDPDHADFEDIRPHVEPILGVRVTQVNWFSIYHVSHRVAADFRVGRCFIAGDAGHIHSPVGGQGMNTGIGDAVNLGWKLAEVVEKRADASLLDSYSFERLRFARSLVATTDRVFTRLIGQGVGGAILRTWLVPHLFAFLAGFTGMRRRIFQTVSQTEIDYRGSPLSAGKAGSVRGGDRLPWLGQAGADNFAPLCSMAWQLHVYGEPRPELSKTALDMQLPVHGFVWSDAAKEAGLARDAAYLVRPDGHVGLASPGQDVRELRDYVTRLGLRFTSAA